MSWKRRVLYFSKTQRVDLGVDGGDGGMDVDGFMPEGGGYGRHLERDGGMAEDFGQGLLIS